MSANFSIMKEDSSEIADLALLSTGFALVILQVGSLYCGVGSRMPWVQWSAAVESFRARIWRKRTSSGVAAEFQACVEKGVTARIEADMASAHAFVNQMFPVSVVPIVYSLLADTPRWMSFAQTCAFFALFAVSTVANLPCTPSCIRWPVTMYNIAMAGAVMLAVTARRDPACILFTLGSLVPVRVAMGICYHRMPQVIAWNFVFDAASIYVSANTFGHEFARVIIVFHIWNTVAVLALSRGAARQVEASARREVEASVLRDESSGLWNLLDLVCDVVVTLDERLAIIGESARFAALVMMQGRGLEGTRLQDLMPSPEDQEAFHRCVHADAEDDGRPRMLHVRLRDSLGNLLPVEVFCVPFQTPVRKGCYVGVREFSDSLPIPEVRTFGRPRRPRHGRGESTRAGPHVQVPARGTPSVVVEARGFLDDASGSRSRGSRSSRSSRSSSSGDSGGGSSSSSSISSSSGQATGSRRGRHDVEIKFPSPRVRRPPATAPLGRTCATTSDLGMELALVQLMRLCSVPAQDECCPFHRRIEVFHERLRSLQKLECAPCPMPDRNGQCEVCGLILEPPGNASRAGLGDRRRGRCFSCECDFLPAAQASRCRLSL